MKLQQYLKEDSVSQALELPEPKVGGDYPSEKVKRYIEIINKALQSMTKREENEANDAIVSDLRDKKKKWSNVDKETKPKKTKTELPPEQEEEPPPPEEAPPQQQQEQPPPPKEEGVVVKNIRMFLR